jgi:hypothetical protein
MSNNKNRIIEIPTRKNHYLYRVINETQNDIRVCVVAKKVSSQWNYFSEAATYCWDKPFSRFTGVIGSDTYLDGIKIKLDSITEIMYKMGYNIQMKD